MKNEVYTRAEPIFMRKQIGSTVYQVNVGFNPEAKETVEEKILRLIKNDLTGGFKRGIMRLPQTVRLHTLDSVERSSA
jgi:hypothetical protein